MQGRRVKLGKARARFMANVHVMAAVQMWPLRSLVRSAPACFSLSPSLAPSPSTCPQTTPLSRPALINLPGSCVNMEASVSAEHLIYSVTLKLS